MTYEFTRSRVDKISENEVKAELERVAGIFEYREFGYREFDQFAEACSSSTVKRVYGSWKKALQSLDSPLKLKSKRQYTDRQLFEEMDRVWVALGHRPSRIEWESSDPNISYNTYKYTFGNWTDACLKFIEYKMGSGIEIECSEISTPTPTSTPKKSKPQRNRNVSPRLRLKVLERDDFRCVLCGRSPVTDFGVKLQIDHVVPFSKGGTTEFENLQTLCWECNIGKGDKEVGV